MIQQLAPKQIRGQSPFPDTITSPSWDVSGFTITDRIELRALMDAVDVADANLTISLTVQGSFDGGVNYVLLGAVDWRGGNVNRTGQPLPLRFTVGKDSARGWPSNIRGRAVLSRAVNLGMEAEIV